MSEARDTSREEIHKSLDLCNFCTRIVGLSFTDELPKCVFTQMRRNLLFSISVLALILLLAGETAYVTGLVIKTTSVAEFVATLHLVGYALMSINKLLTLWFKRHTFRKLIEELSEIWPLAPDNQEEEDIKRESLKALRFGQFWYTFFNVLGVVMYNVTPIGVYLYWRIRGLPSNMGYVWHVSYPFDKTRAVYHELVYCFEAFAGTVSVMSMLGSDMMFTTMASHISLLLRVLQVKIRHLAAAPAVPAACAGPDSSHSPSPDYIDCYPDIVNVIKIHQRLISYSNDIEDTFSLVNLINVLLSSVDICCVVFVIVLLEPWMDMSSKFFLGAAMTQIGILCWYADDIFRASLGVADAAYESAWYRASARARCALVVLMQRWVFTNYVDIIAAGGAFNARFKDRYIYGHGKLKVLYRQRRCEEVFIALLGRHVYSCNIKIRSQKPLYFTALKFRPITLTTYGSIITTSYSYFTLLYTIYRSD